MKLDKKIFLGTAIVFLSFGPLMALAQGGGAVNFTTTVPPNLTTVTQVYNLTVRVLGYLQTFFWIIAVIFVVIAAYKYLTSGGDTDKIGEAKHMLIYAVLAIVVALIATAVVSVVQSFVNSG